jgi:cell division protein FtsZ
MVIGVGGGGNNAVSYMYPMGLKDVDFVVCNTDVKSMERSPVPIKLQIGPGVTGGLGTGMDHILGRKAAEESVEEIEKLLDGDSEMVFVTCGMGGGTGTGASPVIAKLAKEKGKLTVGVVTIPFRDEGNESLYRAVEGIKEMAKHVDSLLVIDNQKLYDLYGMMSTRKGFAKANEVLATAVKSISEVITTTGEINVDFNDVKKVMQNSGVAIMGIGEAEGENRAVQAVENALNSPLLNDLNLQNVKNALINITGSSDDEHGITLSELSQIMEYTKQYTGATINFKRGIVYDEEMGDRISVTIIATGFEMWQLPVIDENEVNRANSIDIRPVPDLFASRKRGAPLAQDIGKRFNKPLVPGIPSLIEEDIRRLKTLEEETAYTRRYKLLATA